MNDRVLIVDDDEVIRTVLREVLDNAQYDVLEACNGVEAMEVLKTEDDVALILLDWLMPEMDGLQTLQMIREQEKWQKIPIIMQTTVDTQDDVRSAIQSGVSDYMIKPIRKERLLEKVSRALHAQAS